MSNSLTRQGAEEGAEEGANEGVGEEGHVVERVGGVQQIRNCRKEIHLWKWWCGDVMWWCGDVVMWCGLILITVITVWVLCTGPGPGKNWYWLHEEVSPVTQSLHFGGSLPQVNIDSYSPSLKLPTIIMRLEWRNKTQSSLNEYQDVQIKM